jgi:hypothetical protein
LRIFKIVHRFTFASSVREISLQKLFTSVASGIALAKT